MTISYFHVIVGPSPWNQVAKGNPDTKGNPENGMLY